MNLVKYERPLLKTALLNPIEGYKIIFKKLVPATWGGLKRKYVAWDIGRSVRKVEKVFKKYIDAAVKKMPEDRKASFLKAIEENNKDEIIKHLRSSLPYEDYRQAIANLEMRNLAKYDLIPSITRAAKQNFSDVKSMLKSSPELIGYGLAPFVLAGGTGYGIHKYKNRRREE